MMRVLCFLSLLTLGACAVRADQYWIAWEGTELPEVQGPWLRSLGYGGAKRTINNGILTYDSLHNINIWDYSYIERQRKIDPGPGEMFVMEWRLRVRKVIGDADPTTSVASDEAWMVGFAYAEDRIFSVFENFLEIPIEPGRMHEYRLLSTDMRAYDLFIDGGLVRRGAFSKRITSSYVGWGDGVQGAASLHEWDYFRFGVIPEPATGVSLAVPFLACVVGANRRVSP